MGAASLSISKWERERSVMRTLINVGELGPEEERWPEDETYGLEEHPSVDRLLRTAQPYFNAVDDPGPTRTRSRCCAACDKESDIGVPIVVEGEVWGEVWATTGAGSPRFTGRDVRFLEAIAGQLGGVVARGEMFSRVSRLAYEDELTGLSNRRALDEQLAAALDAWRESGQPLALLACDVDELKTINDERGHHAGDRALRRVGQALVKAAASVPGACVARMSGDEFAVVMVGADLAAAGSVASTALRILREERDTAVSVSCGVAAAGPGTERPESLMRAADAAQYAAKRRGGAQVCSAGRDDFHELLSAGEAAPQRRRGRRRSQAERTEEACGRALDLLDGSLAQRGDARTAWRPWAARWRRWSTPRAGRSPSPCTATTRSGRWPPPTGATRLLRGMRVGLEDEVYALSDYPATAEPGRRRAAARSTWTATTARPTAPSAACWTRSATPAVLAAAATDPEGCYLLEIYADGDTRDLTGLTVSLSLLVRAAAANSASAMDRVRAPAPPDPPHHRDQRRRPQAGGRSEPARRGRGGGRGAARRVRLVADRRRPPDRRRRGREPGRTRAVGRAA